ncbi:hypothetical protein GCK72_004442 [Caenorhabditis remanei]|uniref:Fucosyltransferase n=1 Tax=Caenorhabditis remanei TaxID=31234 RepID=A0A6A5HCC7_CAERE|nr:hypothetical protein GCK72_004442 [Caenorhabditis remanei]KAF1764494.1 hypothetical protein GCK72_004442 [Caenorhabditis remanei]
MSYDGDESRLNDYLNLTGKIVVYAATPFFGSPITNSYLKNCPESVKTSCIITNKKRHFSNAHAVLFHSRDIDEKKLGQLKRRTDIPYIMMASENPYYANMKKYENYFNWTMTYRRDSDVYYPYGALVKTENLATPNYTEIWTSKTKDTLWLVSNTFYTQNKRKEVVDKLVSLGMNIDRFGKIYMNEPKWCPRNRGPEGCDEKLHSPYKFTIAFENSNCKDYVTEKFWRKAGRYKVVPIVMERKIYKNLGIPDDMYIAIDDYPNLTDFVEHIQKISENETEYIKYHKWRENYRIVDTNEDNYGFCQLCQKLGKQMTKKKKKSYENLAAWHSTLNCDNSFANRYLK